MARILVYYAHPGNKYSRVNCRLADIAAGLEGVSYVDLYAEYPRFDIDVNIEQKRLLEHDVIIFQHPVFWYSTPSLIKEWFDLVLEHGFAYGTDGNKLKDKVMMNAVTAAGSKEAYTDKGFQNYPLRDFFKPLEQTANLCGMKYAAPYVLYSSLQADEAIKISEHVEGYKKLLRLMIDDDFDYDKSYSSRTLEAQEVDSFKKMKGGNND
jgi:glutathione-regulated potassium-efflux system ancillary protein KefG